MILGIAGFDHDGSITLLDGSEILGHWERERICRKRYAGIKSPEDLVQLLDSAQIQLNSVDKIAWGDADSFEAAEYVAIRDFLTDRFPGIPVEVVDHHTCHLASAFYASGFQKSAILSIDGKGDSQSAAWGIGDREGIRILGRQPSSASIGRVWWALSMICGYPHFGGAGKVMALAAYGSPTYLDSLLEITRLLPDGRFSFFAENEDMFSIFRETTQIARWFSNRFAISFAQNPSQITTEHQNMAASVQEWSNRVINHIVTFVLNQYSSGSLCLGGGVALNIISNTRLRSLPSVKNMFVQPAAGDSGLSIGAAYALKSQHANHVRKSPAPWSVYLGRSFSDQEVEKELQISNCIEYRRCEDISIAASVALANNEIIGWFQGREESGPRALGARSLFARPDVPGIRDEINRRKSREAYRPCALTCLEESFYLHFEGYPSRYMLFNVTAKPTSFALLHEGLHVDGSTRIQVVDSQAPKILRELLNQFQEMTGIPALINTSLNARGEPIVGHPRDAIELLIDGQIDRLFIGSFEVWKSPNQKSD